MGLFDFIKNKNNNNNVKSPVEFYKECLEDFHNEANTCGVANRGLIFIPELIPLGEKTILAYLQSPHYQRESGGDPETYYYLIMSNAIKVGMALATRWHEDVSKLNSYVHEVTLCGPGIMGAYLFVMYFPIEVHANNGEAFCRKIYSRWLDLHEPYWELEDPRDYTFKALLAAYQLGVSMILEKYGY